MGEPGLAWPVVRQADRHAEIAPINEITKWRSQVCQLRAVLTTRIVLHHGCRKG